MPEATAQPLVKWTSGTDRVSLPSPEPQSSPKGRTLYLFLDESGNFDFEDTGTKYFIMTCLVCHRPFNACHDLMDLKYDLFENGVTMKKFHATEDGNKVKTAVYDAIGRHARNMAAYSIYVDKGSLPEGMKDPAVLYAQMFEWILDEALDRETDSRTKRIVVVTDDLPKEAKKKQVVKPLKVMLNGFRRRTGIPYCLEHFPSESDYNLQIADYLCWAFMRLQTQGHSWPYSKVQGIFKETGTLAERQ